MHYDKPIDKPIEPRSMTGGETKLLLQLIQKAGDSLGHYGSLDGVMVQPMSDGGMGSLYFIRSDKSRKQRMFGKRVAEIQYKDEDGVDVIASLNIDVDGELFELDVWKTDFRPLVHSL